MDKNIAALLRDDARTVGVNFSTHLAAENGSPASPYSEYTYVSHLQLAVGDIVVVKAKGRVALATVSRVDDSVDIEPNADMRYAWVIAKVDVSEHAANMARNAEIERAVSEAYRDNMRRSFAQQILGGVEDGEKKARLLALTSKTAEA